MRFTVLGAAGTGASCRLDYRAFAYAGKFVTGGTGKAVLETEDGSPAAPAWEPERPVPDTVDPTDFDEAVVAAVSFSPDRTDPACCRIRYVTVHVARRGAGVGPTLVLQTVRWLSDAGYDQIRIAVNNPFAYEALYKCGFAYTDEQTGLAELELARPAAVVAPARTDADRYRAGLQWFRDDDTDRADAEQRFLASRLDGDDLATPPALHDSSGGST